MAVQTNTFAAKLAALNPDHSWPMDEASGSFVDEFGSVNLGTSFGNQSNGFWRQAPGVIRGTPREYGIWTQGRAYSPSGVASPTTGSNLTSFDADGWVTGCIACAGVLWADYEQLPIFALNYNSLSASFIQLRINTDRSITLECTDGVGNTMEASTPAATVVLGEPYVIVAQQTGSGVEIYYNAVSQTITYDLSGDGTQNSWADDLLHIGATPYACTRLSINRRNNEPTTQTTHAIIQRPTVWINSTLAASEVEELHESAQLGGVIADIYDAFIDLSKDDTDTLKLRNLSAAWSPSPVSTGGSIDPLPAAGLPGTGSAYTATGTELGDNANLNEAEADVISDFAQYRVDFGSVSNAVEQQIQVGEFGGLATPNWWDAANDSEGAIIFIGRRTNGVTQGTTKPLYTYNTGNGAQLKFQLVNTLGTYQIRLTLTDENSDTLTVTGNSTIQGNDLFVAIATQEGDEIRLYVNGEQLTTTTTGAAPTSSWISDLGTYGPNSQTCHFCSDYDDLFGDSGTWAPNDWVYGALSATAWTAEDVATFWDAVNGIYPDAPEPEGGGFFDIVTSIQGGADHYWRMNIEDGNPLDIGVSEIDGTVIAVGGDPVYGAVGPFVEDSSNAAIYFDGQNDYFEVGVDGATGALVEDDTQGTVGFFISVAELRDNHIVYSQSDDTGAAFIRFGVNAGIPEFKLQTSAGNSVTMQAGDALDSSDFLFFVITNNGENYIMYIQGVADVTAEVTVEGTGAEGQWFDDITTTRTALSALATATFPTETNARTSEIFIFDEVLTAAQIAAMFTAAEEDGLGLVVNSLGVLQFDNVTFLDGSAADIYVEQGGTSGLQQVVKLDKCHFRGGYEADQVASVVTKGDVKVMARGSTWDLNTEPTTGRAAFLATQVDPTEDVQSFGSLDVAECTFDRMGHVGNEILGAIHVESGYKANLRRNKFFDSVGAAMGWRADARQLHMQDNIVDGLQSGLAALYGETGLNNTIGNNWKIHRNKLVNLDSGLAIFIDGSNASAAGNARRIQIRDNHIADVLEADGIAVTNINDTMIVKNRIKSINEGIRLGLFGGSVTISHNEIEGNAAEAIVSAETVTQTGFLVVRDNDIDGNADGDGISVTNIENVAVVKNKLSNLQVALALGTIADECKVFGNIMRSVTTTIDFTDGTVPAGLDMGQNTMLTPDEAKLLAVVDNAINVFAPFHTVDATATTNLDTLGGGKMGDGRVMVLAYGGDGTAEITLLDDDGDMRLTGDYTMNVAGEQIWLVHEGGLWYELSRL